MEDNQTSNASNDAENNRPGTTFRKRTRRRRFAAIVIAIVGAGIAIPMAFADRGGRWGRHNLTDDQVKEKMHRGVDFALDFLDGDDQQEATMHQLVDDIFPDVVAFRAEGKALKKKFREVLLAETVDRKELENLRQEMLSLVDRASLKGLETIATGSEALTVEQKDYIRRRLEKRDR